MKSKSILIIGAKSDVAIAVAYKFAQNGFDLLLAGREISELQEQCSDIEIRFDVSVKKFELDILNYTSFEKFISELNHIPKVVFCAVGALGKQKEDERNIETTSMVMKTNYEAPSLLLGLFANIFEKRKEGTIIAMSSVAGERGRGSNYIYGSSKSGFTAFLSGLRNRLHKSNVRVVSVVPGFIKTKMTKGLNLPKLLTTNPEDIANVIFKSFKNKSKNIIFYKRIWFFIMIIIKNIPESIFKRLKL
tara:strand:- start:734 stop:1474 length:741 start_codon:yes stop_codon:yes gene_type:complete